MRAVTLYATSRCNLRCKHCGVGPDQEKPRPQLETEDLKVVLTRLAASGTQYVTILGGEATVYREDLGTILDHAAAVGIGIAINTNLLVYAPIAGLLDRPALKSLIVSLDGASAETHDRIRGRGTFARTVENAKKAAASARASTGELTVEVSFVMSQLNLHDAGGMVPLAESLGANRLNVNTVKIIGRAARFSEQLVVSRRDVLDAYCSLVVTWLLSSRIQLDVYIPPALAFYLNRRFGLNLPTDHPACGGIREYGYVDLLGNHLPCPAMSFEEDPVNGLRIVTPELNLLTTDAGTARQTSRFVDFEARRSGRVYRQRMFPCRYCRFSDVCSPCTADFVRGASESEVEICAAVFEHGDESVPGVRREVFDVADPASAGAEDVERCFQVRPTTAGSERING